MISLDAHFTLQSLFMTLGEYSMLYLAYQNQWSLITNHRTYRSLYIKYNFMTLEEIATEPGWKGEYILANKTRREFSQSCSVLEQTTPM